LNVNREVLQETDGESTLVKRLASSLDKQHRDGREEVSCTESLDESNEEAAGHQSISLEAEKEKEKKLLT
jgi:hypothetical protein